MIYSEPFPMNNLKAFICSKQEEKLVVYVSGNNVDIYYMDKYFIN